MEENGCTFVFPVLVTYIYYYYHSYFIIKMQLYKFIIGAPLNFIILLLLRYLIGTYRQKKKDPWQNHQKCGERKYSSVKDQNLKNEY